MRDVDKKEAWRQATEYAERVAAQHYPPREKEKIKSLIRLLALREFHSMITPPPERCGACGGRGYIGGNP